MRSLRIDTDIDTVVPRHTEMKNFEDGFQESDDPLSSSSQEFTVYPEPEPKLISHVKHTKKRKSQPVERISYNEIEKKEYDEKRAKKIRKSEPVTWKKTDTDEYEEDIGRNESMWVTFAQILSFIAGLEM